MPRERHPEELAKYRTVSFPVKIDTAIEQFAEETTGGNVAEAIRLLVRQALGQRGGLSGLSVSLEESGYNSGVRQGLQEARAAIAGALNELWRSGS